MDNMTKNFCCKNEDCTMSFSSEDQLVAHVKRHEMVLNLGSLKGNLFNNDQTPTPTRFIRNCDEVGLFQDLQNVNPFDETFRRAVEQAKNGGGNLTVPLSNIVLNDDTLHTPHIFPNFANIGDSAFLVNREQTDQQLKQVCATNISNERHSQNALESMEMDPSDVKIQEDDSHHNQSFSTINNNTEKNKDEQLNITEHVEINLNKRNDMTENQLISITNGNKVLLPILEQIHLSAKDAEQILANHNSKLDQRTTMKKTINVKDHLKATLLKNTKSVGDQKASSTITKIQQVPPILISSPYSTVISTLQSENRNLCKILPKDLSREAITTIAVKPNLKTQSKHKEKTTKTVITRKPTVIEDPADEQRKEFLARSRAAASRWRFKKKEQIRELINRNHQLENENSWLRSECTQLKKMLLAHKNCSVTQTMALGQNLTIVSAAIIPENIQGPVVEVGISPRNEMESSSCP